MKQTRKSPRTETGTRTFSKRCVVLADGGAEIAVATMSITTLHGFREDHVEALLSEFAQISRAFYLEAGNAPHRWVRHDPASCGRARTAYTESRQLVIIGTYANDTPLQPQSERSKRRRQWVGPRENHAGVKVPWCWLPPAVRFMPIFWNNHLFSHYRERGFLWLKKMIPSKPRRCFLC